jgi:hypothetical protein
LHYLLFFAVRHPKNLESVSNQVFLEFEVEGGISCETWCMVDFEQPRLELVVNQNVEAQHFEAERVFRTLLAALHLALVWGLQIALQSWLNSQDCPYDDEFDLQEKLVHFVLSVGVRLANVAQNRSESPFVANVRSLGVVVELEDVFVPLVNCVVCQMHKLVFDVCR